jgi:hypothetical protein
VARRGVRLVGMLRLVEMRSSVPSNGSSGHVQLKVEAREAAKHVADPCVHVEVEEYYKAKHSTTTNDNYLDIHS